MTDRPPIFLTNAASVRLAKKGTAKPETAARVGPGDAWTIMCRPRVERGEVGRGFVWALAPDPDSLDNVRKSRMTLAEYRTRYLEAPGFLPMGPPNVERVPRFLSRELAHGRLVGKVAQGRLRGSLMAVEPGDTLMCCCGADAADAGECHRVWAGALLFDAGWAVVMDGREVESSAELLARGHDAV